MRRTAYDIPTTNRFWAIIAFCLLSTFVCGCYTANMGSVEEEIGKQYQISVNSVDQVVPKISFVKALGNGRRQYSLELIAHGGFAKHNGIQCESRERYLCVGFFPGAASWKATVRKDNGSEKGWPVGAFFGNLLCNCLLCGIPTVSSLIVEPFLPYYWDENQTSVSDFGFVGFRKYIKRGNQRFVERTTERINAQVLFGYKVFIDGAECNDDLTANGYVGKALFNTTRPSGSKLVIKLLSAPVIREDSNDRIADLVGVEMEAILP